MGKVALLAIAAFTVMGVYYGATSQSGMMATSESVAAHEYTVLAKNVALTGFSIAQQKLAAPSFTCPAPMIAGTYGGGSYTVQYSPCQADDVTVTSTGQIIGDFGDVHFYKVVATFHKQTTWDQPSVAPAFMEYALIADKDLTIKGVFLTDTASVSLGAVEGATKATYNANVHTNGKLTVKGNAATIRGYGTYKTAQDVQHPNVFKPYDVKDHLSTAVVWVPEGIPIPIDDYDPDALRTKLMSEASAKGVYKETTGDVVLAGTYDFTALGATREHPYVWYINGNLKSNGAKISGYAVFLVKGGVDFGGNVDVGNLVGPAESNFAFYTTGDISLHGNSSVIWGQMVTRGNVVLGGTPKIYGSVVCYGTFTGNGTPDIYYFPPSPALASPVADTRWQRTSYLERDTLN